MVFTMLSGAVNLRNAERLLVCPILEAKVKLKIGLDIHGVCNENHEFFATLSQLLVENGHEVHLITGPPRFKSEEEAKNLGLSYTDFFSITDHYVALGVEVLFNANGDPFMDEYLWDKAKADYCLRKDIHLHLDDSDVYGYFFKTPYARYFSNKRKYYPKL